MLTLPHVSGLNWPNAIIHTCDATPLFGRCFEVVVLVAGLQADAEVQLGAMGVQFATHALAFMLAAGFGGAAATRVSNELGASGSSLSPRLLTS